MTHAEKLYETLAKERAGGTLTKERWLVLVTEAFKEAVAQATSDPLGFEKPKHKKPYLDSLFDALAKIQGTNVSQLTRSAKGCIVEARKQIMEATPGVTAEEIERRAALYRRRHPTWPCTATALTKHWPSLGPAINATQLAKEDIYQEPEGDWRAAALKAIGIAEFPKEWLTWGDVPVNYRAQIKKATV